MGKWDQITTKHGYSADEIISALQKDIRRGNEELAMIWAYEMIVSGKELTEKFWSRVSTIATEDIGFANPQAAILVQSLRASFGAIGDERSGDQILQAIYAAAYLARSKKDRYLDEAIHYIIDLLENQKKYPQIPDYAIDKHTRRGQEMGRDLKHFFETGAKIAPVGPDRDKRYLKLIAEKFDLDIGELS